MCQLGDASKEELDYGVFRMERDGAHMGGQLGVSGDLAHSSVSTSYATARSLAHCLSVCLSVCQSVSVSFYLSVSVFVSGSLSLLSLLSLITTACTMLT